MKKAVFASLLLMLLVTAAIPAVAATSAANLKGTYNIQFTTVNNYYGYHVCPGPGDCNWVPVSGQCPPGETCESQAFPKTRTGTLYFDGKGHATFKTFATYEPGCGSLSGCASNSPFVIGEAYEYSVSGFTANLTIPAGSTSEAITIVFSLGSFNSSGIPTVLLVLVPEVSGAGDQSGHNLFTGVANLQ